MSGPANHRAFFYISTNAYSGQAADAQCYALSSNSCICFVRLIYSSSVNPAWKNLAVNPSASITVISLSGSASSNVRSTMFFSTQFGHFIDWNSDHPAPHLVQKTNLPRSIIYPFCHRTGITSLFQRVNR